MPGIKNILLCIIFILLPLSINAQEIEVLGVVFHDANNNGIKDPHEKGIANVPVSDGCDFVLTNKKGEYLIKTHPGNFVFSTPPSLYEVIGRNNEKCKNSVFLYIDSTISVQKSIIYNIPLKQIAEKGSFRIAAIGDIQMKDFQEISYANQSVIAELMGREDIDFNIFLGDQINETLNILPDVKQMIENLPASSWTVLGNHDRNVKNTYHQDDIFNYYFGASHYAFNYGNVHFIVLNNIYSEGGRSYTGLVSDRQLKFIENDLKYVSHDKQIVICQHIPLVYTKNKDAIIELLKERKEVLVLSGHTHQISRHFIGNNIHELVTGASCGNWWVGERDWQGIPTALMQCGSPRNYFIIDFDKNSYNINYKGIGMDESIQMDIWVNGQDTTYQYVENLKDFDKNLIVANIYGGSDSTRVVMQIDDLPVTEMKKTNMVAPNVSRLIQWNKDKIYPTKYSRRGALRNSESPHIWTGNYPVDLPQGIHSVKIYAEDNRGFKVKGSRLIYVNK